MKLYKNVFKFNNREQFEKQISNELGDTVSTQLSRPEHVLSVYYLGDSLIKEIFGFRVVELNTGTQISFNNFWKYIAIFHDIGYGPQYQRQSLLKDFNSNALINTYLGYVYDVEDKNNNTWLKSFRKEELAFYYAYWQIRGRDYCLENGWSDGYELFEHGILGGCIFSELFHNQKPKSFKGDDNDWNDLVLAVTLVIAQHNIWPVAEDYLKSFPFDLCDGKDHRAFIDKNKFIKNNINFSYKIDLLSYSICLIDSIDITKRFYGVRNKDGYEDIVSYELLNEVLKVIDFSINRDGTNTHIIINAGDVKTVLKTNNLIGVYSKWVDGIKGMKEFLDLNVLENDSLIDITIHFSLPINFKEKDSVVLKDMIIWKSS